MSTTTTFPAVALRELEPREAATYDKRTGLYIITRRWEIMGLDWSAALSAYTASLLGVTIPETFIQTYTEDGITPVTMIAVARHTEKMAEKPDSTPCCILTVTYEGHACLEPLSGSMTTTTAPNGYAGFNGVVSGHFEFGTKSELLIVSFDRDVDGRRIPIGSPGEAEGTNRLVPNCRLVIVQNMREVDFYNRVPMIAGLIGLLNEDLWEDPVISKKGTYGYQWWEGMWLYLGPKVAENRDGTFTLTHEFEFDARPKPFSITSTTAGNISPLFGSAFYYHKFLWYDKSPQPRFNTSTGVTKFVNVPVEPPHLSTIYETAGPTVSLGYYFADLFLAREALV